MKDSIIIPCYNEEDTIRDVLERVRKVDLGCEKEVIVIDDGSTDRSDDVIKEFGDVILIKHEMNKGKGVAVQTGINNSSGDVILIQDADLEYFPEDIPKLVKPILEGKADVVLGSRFLGEIRGMSMSHLIGNKFLTYATRLLFWRKITDVMTCYKIFRKELLKDVTLESKDFAIETELMAKFLSQKMSRFIEIPIRYQHRLRGKSKISWKHGFTSLWNLLKFGPARAILQSFRSWSIYFQRASAD